MLSPLRGTTPGAAEPPLLRHFIEGTFWAKTFKKKTTWKLKLRWEPLPSVNSLGGKQTQLHLWHATYMEHANAQWCLMSSPFSSPGRVFCLPLRSQGEYFEESNCSNLFHHIFKLTGSSRTTGRATQLDLPTARKKKITLRWLLDVHPQGHGTPV